MCVLYADASCREYVPQVRNLEEEVERLKGLLSSKGAQSKGTNQRVQSQSQSRAASSQAGNRLLAEILLMRIASFLA